MNKSDTSCLATLGLHPAAVAGALLDVLGLPDDLELAALLEDGVTTFDASIAVDQPAVFADYLAHASTRIDVLTQGTSTVQHAISGVRGLLRKHLPEAAARTTEDFLDRAVAVTTWSPPAAPTSGEFGALASTYLELVLDGRRDGARALVRDALRGGATIREILIDVLETAQREVGRRWEVGKISVAQEHYSTAVTQMVLTDLYPSLFAGTQNSRRLVAVDAPGSLHQIGLRMVVDLLQYEGWDTDYVGPASPEEAVERVAKHQADILAVSVSMPGQLPVVRTMIASLRADPRTRCVKILVGGRPFTLAPDLVAVVGGDAWAANATDAVTVCDRLVPATASPGSGGPQ